MSGKNYSMKNLQMEVNTPVKENKTIEEEGPQNSLSEIKDVKDYESMVSTAESKCTQLKNQLERIKQYYNAQTESKHSIIAAANNHPTSASHPMKKKIGITEISTNKENSINKGTKTAKIFRQNSNAIGTDTSGAALGTINNILAGITKTLQTPNPVQKSKQPSELQINITNDIEQPEILGVEDVKINTKLKEPIPSKSKFSVRKSKSKVVSKTSSTNFKKIKKPSVSDKKRKTSDTQVPKVFALAINKRPKKMLIKPKIPTFDDQKKTNVIPSMVKSSTRNPDLVEIYHNNAVKQSKSSESDITKKKLQIISEKNNPNLEIIPPLNIGETEDTSNPTKNVVCIYKNYTLPTISSRMKQVAKYYMNSFNIRTIPFCTATSTTPSHNIGINIQQVMSMVKSKQPNIKLSPTLAYNIGLAAGKWEDNPLDFLGSSLAPKTFYPQCPLSKSTVNYQHLQEIAKTIPEDIIEESAEMEGTTSPDAQSMIITGPSGDVKVTNRKQTTWTANSDEKKCTCVVPKGVGFQQIVNKFNGTVSKSKMNTTTPFIAMKMKDRKLDHVGCGEVGLSQPTEFTPLQNKEKKLKEVLGKLHDEFEKMTKKYDELAKINQDGKENPETIKELEKLDSELNSKEEEIVMVMSLYKEVLALKQQVKSLKELASKDNISIRSQTSRFSTCNNMATAGLLNKLLQRVHYFQTHYRRR